MSVAGALLVAAGAAVGGLTRWILGGVLSRDFPHGVMVANLAGSFLIGLILFAGDVEEGWRLLVVVGFLGALTTMSTFASDTIAFVDAGDVKRAVVNVIVNPVLGILSVVAGRAVALAVTGSG